MRGSRFLAVALFLAGVVAVVEAQPGGGRQQGPFGGGVHTLVLNNKALQDELKITDEQKEKLKGVADKQADQTKKRAEAVKDAAGDREKMKELFSEFAKGGEKLQEEVKTTVDATLTADQKKRLKQIERQIGGVRAFAADDVAAELKLTDAQKTKIASIGEEYQKDAKELRGGFGGGKGGFDKEKMAENQKKREKLTKATMADIEDVLTADQKKQWKDLTGEPFDTTKLFQGFGGGQGGRRPTPKKTD